MKNSDGHERLQKQRSNLGRSGRRSAQALSSFGNARSFSKEMSRFYPERFGVRGTTWHHDSQEMEDVHIEHRPPLTIQACCGKDPDRSGSDSIGANGKGCEYHCRLFERTRDVLHKQKTSDACGQRGAELERDRGLAASF